MSAIDNINQAILNVSNLIQEITVDPQPSYSIQAVSYSWSEYLSVLTEQQLKLQEVLIALSGPYQVTSIAVT